VPFVVAWPNDSSAFCALHAQTELGAVLGAGAGGWNVGQFGTFP